MASGAGATGAVPSSGVTRGAAGAGEEAPSSRAKTIPVRSAMAFPSSVGTNDRRCRRRPERTGPGGRPGLVLVYGGARVEGTPDLVMANDSLSQLSYGPAALRGDVRPRILAPARGVANP